MYDVQDWAEVRRLHRDGWSKSAIAEKFGMSRNTVAGLLGKDEPPRYERTPAGSMVRRDVIAGGCRGGGSARRRHRCGDHAVARIDDAPDAGREHDREHAEDEPAHGCGHAPGNQSAGGRTATPSHWGSMRQVGGAMPPPWITYSPLPPLALLVFTGLYMFVLPYAVRWRGGRRA